MKINKIIHEFIQGCPVSMRMAQGFATKKGSSLAQKARSLAALLSVRGSINQQNIDIGIRLIKILRQNRSERDPQEEENKREKLILYHGERLTFQIMFRIRKYLSLPDSVM
jgi:hypothetical protein